MTTQIVDPLVSFVIKLPRRYTLRVMVWSCKEDMYANTPEQPRKDYEAVFISTDGRGRCIGTIHLSVHDIVNGTRSHEITHAVDEFSHRAFSEVRASVDELITNEIDRTLMGLNDSRQV